jgi:hypothetical protein
MKKSTINFNKEIIACEIGAFLGAPLVSFIFSHITEVKDIISASAVIGGLIGSTIFWITTRIKNQNKHGNYSVKKLAKDIAYFTPAAFVISIIAYYPTVFFLSRHLLYQNLNVFSSVVSSQVIAFVLFISIMNIYRYVLSKLTGKVL